MYENFAVDNKKYVETLKIEKNKLVTKKKDLEKQISDLKSMKSAEIEKELHVSKDKKQELNQEITMLQKLIEDKETELSSLLKHKEEIDLNFQKNLDQLSSIKKKLEELESAIEEFKKSLKVANEKQLEKVALQEKIHTKISCLKATSQKFEKEKSNLLTKRDQLNKLKQYKLDLISDIFQQWQNLNFDDIVRDLEKDKERKEELQIIQT
uniref:Protein hook-like n=1 Tax=Dermatophagoides pteronyssinus TaxID=6956 RepID=A0A6P6Y9T2_DERPT|nr:protein hook-like [Dermatophagoides pteronyssinus]